MQRNGIAQNNQKWFRRSGQIRQNRQNRQERGAEPAGAAEHPSFLCSSPSSTPPHWCGVCLVPACAHRCRARTLLGGIWSNGAAHCLCSVGSACSYHIHCAFLIGLYMHRHTTTLSPSVPPPVNNFQHPFLFLYFLLLLLPLLATSDPYPSPANKSKENVRIIKTYNPAHIKTYKPCPLFLSFVSFLFLLGLARQKNIQSPACRGSF